MIENKQLEEISQASTRAAHQDLNFWSGVITFGLVSLPVSLMYNNSSNAKGLDLVKCRTCESDSRKRDTDGACHQPGSGKDQLIVIEDRQSDTLIFENKREIGLRRFVPLKEIDSDFFEQRFFFAPDASFRKAYRLLANSMVEENRAGIATFTHGDREYVIAIMADRGLLRVETMRIDND